MNTLIGVIALFTLFILLLYLTIYLRSARQSHRLMKHAKDLLDSNMTQYIMGAQNDYILAVDSEKQIYVYADPLKEFIFHYDSVLAVTLVKYNEIVSECLSPKIMENNAYAQFYRKSKAEFMLKGMKGKSPVNFASIRVFIFLSDENTPLLEIDCFSPKSYFLAGKNSTNLSVDDNQSYRRGLQIGYHIVMLMNKCMKVEDTVESKL